MVQKTFIDVEEPSLMMINHENVHFLDGTKIIGKAPYYAGIIIGTDTLNGRALDESFAKVRTWTLSE